jgi:hypothetical protein
VTPRTVRRSRGALAVGLGLAIAAASCTPRAAAPPIERPYGGPLVDPATVPHDFLDRQQITATYGERTARFDAVLQKRGPELTILALTPFGSRAFVLRQLRAEVTFQSFVPQTMPFPPKYILIDVQRVYFAWAEPSPDAGASPDLEARDRRVERDGEIETEHWEGGTLRRRTFRRGDGEPPGEITIDYGGTGMSADGTPPAHVTFVNGWYGYRLEIATVSHQPL